MSYRINVDWGQLKAGRTVGADALAGCNLRMLVARGVLVPVKSKPRKPVAPATDTANEPEEQ